MTNSNKEGLSIAFLGPVGTFSYLAVEAYLQRKKLGQVSLHEFYSFYDVLSSVETKALNVAVVPVENLVEGSISETLDFLAHSKNLSITGEIILDVHQHIIGLPGTKLENVTTILSHQQPIAQCKTYIRTYLSAAKIEHTNSTTAAIDIVAQKKDNTLVAIGNPHDLDSKGLVILQSNISDTANNQTRFLVIDNQPLHQKGTKVSIVFSTAKDVPGGLYKILKEFADCNINLTKIESRPSKEEMGSYLFFIDLQGDLSQQYVKDALQAIEKKATFFKILGVYEEITHASA